jgi:hypothetical protein
MNRLPKLIREVVQPLERSAQWELGEVEETFPSGL